MSSKTIFTALLLAGFGLVFTATANARGRGQCGCCETSGTKYAAKAQASDGSRVYSYEPGTRYYTGRGTASRSSVPSYLLPKSDPRKYDAR